MALEILRVHLFILLPVLVELSLGKAITNNMRCNTCRQPTSKGICLQFYNDTTDFPGAEQACNDIKCTLMSENEYKENNECVNKYLRDLSHSHTLIWLDWSTTAKNTIYLAQIFNTSGVVGTGDKENAHYSRICIEQARLSDEEIKTQLERENPATTVKEVERPKNLPFFKRLWLWFTTMILK